MVTANKFLKPKTISVVIDAADIAAAALAAGHLKYDVDAVSTTTTKKNFDFVYSVRTAAGVDKTSTYTTTYATTGVDAGKWVIGGAAFVLGDEITVMGILY